jgi:hypothetical protein
MDHFLDYIFLCCLVVAGYLIAPDGVQFWFVVLLVIMSAFMVNSFLSFSATNEFEIYHYGVGPTETRIVFIAINTWIVFYGTDQFYWLLPLACLPAVWCSTPGKYITSSGRSIWTTKRSVVPIEWPLSLRH